jgi:hypothetical protein
LPLQPATFSRALTENERFIDQASFATWAQSRSPKLRCPAAIASGSSDANCEFVGTLALGSGTAMRKIWQCRDTESRNRLGVPARAIGPGWVEIRSSCRLGPDLGKQLDFRDAALPGREIRFVIDE